MPTIQPPEVRHADKPADKVALPRIRLTALLGMLATAALLGVVSAAAGLGAVGWITGLATGSAAAALLVTARMRSDQPAILPADWITLTRMLLIAGVTGLVADSFSRPVSVTALVTLSAVALALDAVDGQVARRTGTATPLGARIDGETDAFLILMLSIAVSQDYGGWVLAIGAARYVFLLAGWLIPWLRAPLAPRFWRKVVAAVQGIALTVAASGVTSRLVGMIAVAAALLLLAESFGHDVIWLYRADAGPRTRRAVRIAVTGLALVLLWFALVAPDRAWQFSLAALVRIPVEALALVAVALVPWNKVGNGSIFDPQPAESESATQVWRSNDTVKQFYGQSIQYTLTALTSWVTELNDPKLVLILLGDHQPHTSVSGPGATHDVPISIITRAPSVLKQMSSWHWQNGLLPAPSAPLEPMDAFRNQLVNTFSSNTPARDASAQGSAATRAAAVSGTSGR